MGSGRTGSHFRGKRCHVSSGQTISKILLSRGRRRRRCSSAPFQEKTKIEKKKKHQRGSGPPIYQAGTDPYQEGGLLPLLGLLFKGMTGGGGRRQRGRGPPIYQAGTDPYQEGGLLPLLGLLFKGMTGGGGRRQRGRGPPIYQAGTDPYQEGGLLFKGVGVNRRHGLFNLWGGSKTKQKKRRKSKYITGSSVLTPDLFCRMGGRPIGVLPDNLSGPQYGMGQQGRCRRNSRHCFQGLP